MTSAEYFNEFNKSFWDTVLPDGTAFCHWGGRAISQEIINYITQNTHSTPKILDYCCGESGTGQLILESIPQAHLHAIDISTDAIKQLEQQVKKQFAKNVQTIHADVRTTRFLPEYYDIICAEDADVFLDEQSTKQCIEQIVHSLHPNGKILIQTYAQVHSHMTKQQDQRITNALSNLGYVHTQPPSPQTLIRELELCGLETQVRNLHNTYLLDEMRMHENFQKIKAKLSKYDPRQTARMQELLECKRDLFKTNSWTGIIIQAQHPKSIT